jgi:hypothetical protein
VLSEEERVEGEEVVNVAMATVADMQKEYVCGFCYKNGGKNTAALRLKFAL